MARDYAKHSKMKKGAPSINKNGRPLIPKGRSISKLRATLNKLKELEPDAIDVIQQSLVGEDVDKERVNTAKWIISSIASLTRTAITEEESKDAFKEKKIKAIQELEEKKEATNNAPAEKPIRFQTTIIRQEEEDDEWEDE